MKRAMSFSSKKSKARNAFLSRPSFVSPNTAVETQNEAPRTLFNVLQSLLRRSSIHVIARLGQSHSIRRKLIWALALVIGLTGLSYEIYRFLNLYLQYPVIITLEVKNNIELEFPAVTVCNLNRFKKNFRICVLRNKSLDDCFFGAVSSATPQKSFRQELLSNNAILHGYENENEYNDVRNRTLKMANNYVTMSAANRYEFGHQADDFILGCSFDNKNCSSSNFSVFQSLQYGNCFTLNAKTDGGTLKVRYSGPNSSGLHLALNLEIEQYAEITESIGARIEIHHPSAQPNPENNGITIIPGFETSIAIEMNTIRRLPFPYRDHCYDYGNNATYSSAEGCMRSCIQKLNYATCGCADSTLTVEEHQEPCNITDEDEVTKNCLDGVLANLDEKSCSCPLPCLSVDYVTTVSSSIWPAREYFREIRESPPEQTRTDEFNCDGANETSFYAGSNGYGPDNSNRQKRKFRKSYAKLKVFYKTLEVKTYKQEPMFQDSELFSQLGGQMGLWMGLSLTAVFECIESLIVLLHFGVRRAA